MRRQKVDGQVERKLLIAMIVSKKFLGQAAPVLEIEKDNLREVPLFTLITEWCLDYWHEYQKAPRKAIETIYHAWADKNQNEDQDSLLEDVHDLLEEISGEYASHKDINVSYMVDQLGEFITKKKLQRASEQLEAALAKGDTKVAGEIFTSFKMPNVGKNEVIDVLNDDAPWKRAFEKSADPIFTYPGAAGRFLNRNLIRDSFLVIQAPEKTGKSYWLMDFAIQALRSRRKVIMFQCGDLSEHQILLRIGSRLSGIPEHEDDCKKVYVPLKITRDDDEDLGVKLDYERRKFLSPLNFPTAKKARQRFSKAHGMSSLDSYFKLSVHDMSSINFAGINQILDQLSYEEDFDPDLILIDYMDILAHEVNRKEKRDMIDETWQNGRSLSTNRHALTIAATQSNAEAFEAKLQSKKHFSNDKRKLSHVSGMIGLNQSEDEKEAQVMRLNWIVNRHAPQLTKRCLWVGQCLSLGQPITCSTL